MESIFCPTQADLWRWLEHNHSQSRGVWLVYYKKSAKKGDLDYSSIVDILLCFGWIDSLPRKMDESRTKLRITPRNPKSNWSRINKEKIAQLSIQNRLQPTGLNAIQVAKENGCWTALDEVEELIIPKDMLTELESSGLLQKWHGQSRSFKRGFLEQLLNSKQPETRQKKIRKLIDDF